MSRTKILYIHHGKGLGGAPLSLLYLIQNLDKEKYHPVVLFLQDSEVVDLYKEKGIEVAGVVNLQDFSHTKIWWYKWYHLHILLKSIFDYFKTTRNVANYWYGKIKPDIVHLNTSTLIAWAKVAYKKKLPVIWHIREPLADGYLGLRKKIVQKFVKKYSTYIVPICKNDAKPWKNNPKVNVIYNAVDKNIFDKNIDLDDFLKKYDLQKDTPQILFLGGLSKEKGTLEILQIFEKLLKKLPEAKLLIAGYFDANLHNFFSIKHHLPTEKYKIKVLNILEKMKDVVFLGPIKNVPQAMQASDVIVFPATQGHFARPIIEAGFMKKTVIASDLSPLDELVINNKTGFLIDIKNQDLWVEKLHKLLTNKNLNNKFSTNSYEFCLKNFDVNDQIKYIEKIYNRVNECQFLQN